MTDTVYLVTAPDDLLVDGVRILLVDLTPEQTQVISDTFTIIDEIPSVIVYIWKQGDDLNWMFDKKHKADIIIFNAESENQTVAGYMAAQHNSYYFGNIKSLGIVKKSAIYNTDDCRAVIEKLINSYE